MFVVNLFIQFLALGIATAHAGSLVAQRDTLGKRLTTSSPAKWDGCLYQVSGVGKFNSHLNMSNWSADFPSTTRFLKISRTGGPTGELEKGTYTVKWDPANVNIDNSDNSLTLTMPGGQPKSDGKSVGTVSCAMLQTAWTDILYGSVRTVAKTSKVPGSIHAAYFYHSDDQEIDIEIQTGNSSYVHWTNQVTAPGSPETAYVSSVSKSSTTYHEYRVDWIPGKTMFYIDGVLKRTISLNVPSTPGPWLWSSWFNNSTFTSNGYTAGPPLQDSVLHIKSIDMYVNRTSIANCGTKS